MVPTSTLAVVLLGLWGRSARQRSTGARVIRAKTVVNVLIGSGNILANALRGILEKTVTCVSIAARITSVATVRRV